jgi:hypothetical protein
VLKLGMEKTPNPENKEGKSLKEKHSMWLEKAKIVGGGILVTTVSAAGIYVILKLFNIDAIEDLPPGFLGITGGGGANYIYKRMKELKNDEQE